MISKKKKNPINDFFFLLSCQILIKRDNKGHNMSQSSYSKKKKKRGKLRFILLIFLK